MSDFWFASYLMLWIVVGLLSFIVIGLLRQLGLIQLRLGPDPGVLITKEGLDRGTQAPAFSAADVRTREVIQLASFRGRRVLLVFVTPTCVACRQLSQHLNDVARQRQGEFAVVTVCHGSEETCREFAGAYRLNSPVLLDPLNAIGESFDVQMTPFAFLLGEDGVVRLRGVVNSWPQLDALVEEEGTVNPSGWQREPVSEVRPGGSVHSAEETMGLPARSAN
jgi:methylamine dehydrogenase accessory protein MauD